MTTDPLLRRDAAVLTALAAGAATLPWLGSDFAVSLALSLFWPLLLVTIGVGIGVWWMSRRTRA